MAQIMLRNMEQRGKYGTDNVEKHGTVGEYGTDNVEKHGTAGEYGTDKVEKYGTAGGIWQR